MCLQRLIDLLDNLGNRLESMDFVDHDNDTCDYFDLTSDDVWNSSPSDLIAIQLNIRGLINKQKDLTNLINRIAGKEKVDLIMLHETWITQSNSHLVNIPGYHHYFQTRSGKKGGGVSILVSNELSSRPCNEWYINETYMECIAVEIKLPGKTIIASSVYRLPNTDHKKFTKTFYDFCKHIARKSLYNIIGLDHNLDLLKSDKHTNTQLFSEGVLENSLLPCITRPTRISKSRATLIDNIIINREIYNNLRCGVLISDLSDHSPCIMSWSGIQKNKKKAISFISKNLDAKQLTALKEDLNINWKHLHETNDVNELFQLFHNHLLSTIEKYTEEKIIKIPFKRIMYEPWLTKGIMVANQKQLKLYKEWLKNKSAILHDRYKQYRNTLKRIKHIQKQTFFTNQCDRYKQNSKQLWCIINDMYSRNNDKTTSINYITIDGIKHYQSDKISAEFTQHFALIGENLSKSTPNSVLRIDAYLNKIKLNAKSIYLYPCTTDEIKGLIMSLKQKKSSGHDGISNIVL